MKIAMTVLLLLMLSGCIFVKVPLQPEMAPVEEQVVMGEGKAKIAVLDISGIISQSRIGLDRFSRKPSLLARFKEELQTAEADSGVVGVVIRIDSPGGSVTASDILYHEIRQMGQRRGIPIVACIMDRGFSGGYYAALGADEIMAHPTSVLGGVGVIYFKVTVSEMLDKWGVQVDTVKSGEEKDFWSPLRPSRPGELDRMQGIVDHLNRRFLDIVRERRKLPPEVLEQIASGGIFHADQARELGLIDNIGYLEDAVKRVAELAGVERARVIIYRRPGAYAESIYAGSLLPRPLPLAEALSEELLGPVFRYQSLSEGR